jgi:hypothetical protein
MYDYSMVDPLVMCLLTGSAFLFLSENKFSNYLGLWLLGLACFTKQPALAPFAVMAIFLLFHFKPRGVFVVVGFWVLIAAILILVTKGWAWQYLYVYPIKTDLESLPSRHLLFLIFVMQFPLWFGLFLSVRHKNHRSRLWALSAAVFVGCISGAWTSGGWINAFFPFEPFLCILAVIGLRKYYLLLGFQIVLGLYQPFWALNPWGSIRNCDRKSVELAQSVPGDVWFPVQTYLSCKAGKKEWPTAGALESIATGGRPFPQKLFLFLREKKFDLIIFRKGTQNNLHPQVREEIEKYYRPENKYGLLIYKPAK